MTKVLLVVHLSYVVLRCFCCYEQMYQRTLFSLTPHLRHISPPHSTLSWCLNLLLIFVWRTTVFYLRKLFLGHFRIMPFFFCNAIISKENDNSLFEAYSLCCVSCFLKEFLKDVMQFLILRGHNLLIPDLPGGEIPSMIFMKDPNNE